MNNQNIKVGIDIGTSSGFLIVGLPQRIKGFRTRNTSSKGLKNGVVVDISTVLAIQEATNKAELMSGVGFIRLMWVFRVVVQMA